MAQSMFIIRWYLVLQILSLAGLPLTVIIFRGLPDRGYPFSRALSILLVTYANWIAVSLGLFSYCTLSLVACAACLLFASLAVLLKLRDEVIGAIRGNLKLIGIYEVLFLAVFLVFIAIRGHDPHIFGTEKFMDFSFITGISRNTSFPPQDQWLSGEAVNYYYFSYLTITNIIKLAAVPAEYGYNLALATLAGLTFVSVSSIAYNLSRRVWVGIAAAVFMVFLGNLDGFREFMSAESIGQYNWWNPSRVIGRGDTINEFPFFTFLHADLHPHVNALPFFMLMIVSVMNITFHRGRISWLYFGYLAILLGGLWVMNPWDLPLSIFLLWLVLIIRVIRDRPGLPKAVAYILAPLIIVVCDRFVLYAPFHGSFQSFSGGFGARIARTGLGQMLLVWGFFLFILFTFLIMTVLRSGIFSAGEGRRGPGPRGARTVGERIPGSAEMMWAIGLSAVLLAAVGLYFASPVIAVVAGCILLSLLVFLVIDSVRPLAVMAPGKMWAFAIAAVIIVAAGGFCFSNMVIAVAAAGFLLSAVNLVLFIRERETTFITVMVLVAFGIFLGCELFFVRDTYGDKLYRMNTIFKFYFQAWALVSIGAACSLPVIFAGLRARGAGFAWTAAFAALLAASLAFPVFATNVRCGGFLGGFNLNGFAYMERDHPGDYEAVMWIKENVCGAPVILEATKDPYSYFSRISSNTGLPTVLGWGNHEGLWRASYDLVEPRKRDIEEIYSTTDVARAVCLLRKYGVRLVYVGELERQLYKHPGLRKFSSFMRPVWRGRESIIYEFLDPLGSSITKGYPQ